MDGETARALAGALRKVQAAPVQAVRAGGRRREGSGAPNGVRQDGARRPKPIRQPSPASACRGDDPEKERTGAAAARHPERDLAEIRWRAARPSGNCS